MKDLIKKLDEVGKSMTEGRGDFDVTTDPKALEAINRLAEKAKVTKGGSFFTKIAQKMAVDMSGGVPVQFDSLFKKISVEFVWWDKTWGILSWKYEHPNGGTNGLNIGRVSFDGDKNKWWIQLDGSRDFEMID